MSALHVKRMRKRPPVKMTTKTVKAHFATLNTKPSTLWEERKEEFVTGSFPPSERKGHVNKQCVPKKMRK
jgi:hypothetical protein